MKLAFSNLGTQSLAAPFPLVRPMRYSSELVFVLLLVAAVCCSSRCRRVPLPKRVTTGIGLKLTYIPPGSFTIGAKPGEPGAKPAEKPHKVTISKGFYMGIHEVSRQENRGRPNWEFLLDACGQQSKPIDFGCPCDRGRPAESNQFPHSQRRAIGAVCSFKNPKPLQLRILICGKP
jgi:hypothetical protein